MATENPQIDKQIVYDSVEAIQAHREALKKEIEKGNKEIKKKWDDLFHPKKKAIQTRSQRFLSMANTGAGLIDGAILGWKLYKKFKK